MAATSVPAFAGSVGAVVSVSASAVDSALSSTLDSADVFAVGFDDFVAFWPLSPTDSSLTSMRVYGWRCPRFTLNLLRRFLRKTRTLSPLTCSTIVAVTVASGTTGVPSWTSSSFATRRTRSNVTVSSTSPLRRGTTRLSFSCTLYCFPAISTIAYMFFLFFGAPGWVPTRELHMKGLKNHRTYTCRNVRVPQQLVKNRR